MASSETRHDKTAGRSPAYRRLKAPCWWCSRRLHRGYGWLAPVDGNPVAFHRYCLIDALWDDEFGRRVEAPEGFSVDAWLQQRSAWSAGPTDQ